MKRVVMDVGGGPVWLGETSGESLPSQGVSTVVKRLAECPPALLTVEDYPTRVTLKPLKSARGELRITYGIPLSYVGSVRLSVYDAAGRLCGCTAQTH